MSPTEAGFIDAPADSFVSDEGWLIVGEEAWFRDDWNGVSDKSRYTIRYKTNLERQMARRKSSREYMRRRRAAANAYA